MEKAQRISKILAKVDWTKIQDYHKKLNILWDIENKDGTVTPQVPDIIDLRNEVEALLLYMFDNDLEYLSYGNWVIFWEHEDGAFGEIRVIFRLIDYLFTSKEENHSPFENTKSIEDLQEDLDCALKDEDYESAAILRDMIHSLDKKD